MKIVVGINTLTSVSRPVYSNHCQFWFRLGRNHPDIDFIMNHPERMSIDRMRNQTVQIAIKEEADYVLFIDDDVMIPADTLKHLLEANKDVVAAWTLIRGYPFDNMFFRWKDESKTNLEIYKDPIEIGEDGLVKVDAIGCSCVLIKTELFKKIPEPWFVTGPFNTEDVYFCLKAQQEVPGTTIVVHPGILTSHCVGLEFVDPLNKAAYMDFMETQFPEIVARKETKPVEIPEGEHIENYEDALRVAMKDGH